MTTLNVLLAIVLIAVWIIAGGPAAVAGVARRALGHVFYARLGRGRLRLRAEIPAELEGMGNGGARSDPQREALLHYEPRATVLAPTPDVPCREETAVLLRQPAAASTSLDVEDVREILAIAPWPAYEELWSVETREPVYPVPAPVAPPDPPMPPAWTPWRPLASPRFDPPLHTGWRRVFNRFVRHVYAGEMERVERALRRKAELERAAEARNAEVQGLADLAAVRRRAARDDQAAKFAEHVERYQRQRNRFLMAAENDRLRSRRYRGEANQPGPSGLVNRVNLAMRTMALPAAVPREWKCRYDADSRVVILEHRYPTLSLLRWHRTLSRPAGPIQFRVSDKEKREAAAKLYPALSLRLACEVARLDRDGLVYGVAVNGWVVYRDPATGRPATGYCATLFARKDDLLQIELPSVDPIMAFARLKGVANELVERGFVTPIVRPDTSEGWPQPRGLVAGRREPGRATDLQFPGVPSREVVN